MDCIEYVDTDLDGAEAPEGFESLSRVSKTEHLCCECGSTVAPGEKHLWEAGLWYGAYHEYATCKDCLSVRISFFVSTGWRYELLWHDLIDHIGEKKGEIGEVHITCLLPAARAKVCDMVERAWELSDG